MSGCKHIFYSTPRTHDKGKRDSKSHPGICPCLLNVNATQPRLQPAICMQGFKCASVGDSSLQCRRCACHAVCEISSSQPSPAVAVERSHLTPSVGVSGLCFPLTLQGRWDEGSNRSGGDGTHGESVLELRVGWCCAVRELTKALCEVYGKMRHFGSGGGAMGWFLCGRVHSGDVGLLAVSSRGLCYGLSLYGYVLLTVDLSV